MSAPVRCPNPECGAVFSVAIDRLGRNVYCLECGRRMTARPHDMTARLEEKRRAAQGGAGAAVERLPLIAILDDIRSLWNVGSMFRSADLCAVRELILCGITGHPPRAEIAKTALGADEAVAWRYEPSARDALAAAVAGGYTAVALESSERAVPIGEFRWPERACLVVGNEVVGVGTPLLDACAEHVQIPVRGVKSSFNVAVAFGIAAQRAAEALAARA